MYILALLLLGIMVVYLLTMDLESSFAFKWMTSQEGYADSPKSEVRIHPEGQYGILLGDSIPQYITCQPGTLKTDSLTIFHHQSLGSEYRLQLQSKQLPLWNEYVRLTQEWARDCDSLFIIYGPVPDTSLIYSVNLCIEENSYGQGIILPSDYSNLPFFSFTRSIDQIERITSIDFFSDLLDNESETYIERNHERLRWSYPRKYYDLRLTENKNLENVNK